MDFIEVGQLTIKPFDLERLLEVKMVQKRNEHTTLFFYGIVKEGVEEKGLEDVNQGTKIQFCHKETVLFSGILQTVQVICKNHVYYLKGTAVSHTILLDLTPKRRSFQENGMAFSKVAEVCIKEKQAKMEYHAEEKKVENLMLQYDETDWEFVKRLASHSNSVLIPLVEQDEPAFLFGIEEGGEYKEKLKLADYTVQKNIELERLLTQSPEVKFQEKDSFLYTFDTDKYCFYVGDRLELNGKPLYISEASLHLLDSVLTCQYCLGTKAALSVPKAYQEEMIGLTLDGKVLKSIDDTVKVHLSIDEQQEEGKGYAFPYATAYTAEQHTGWYVMPEIGDTVQIVFPTKDENAAYAVQSVRKGKTGKTSDPRVKYLRTADGKEIKLDQNEILITAKDGTTFVKLNQNSGVEIITDKEIKVTSGGNITVNGGDNISMTSKHNFNIHAGTNLSVSAGDTIKMCCHDNLMKMETPSTGIEVSAKKPIRITGKDTISVTSDGKMSATSKDELQMTATKKMALTSSETMELVCKTNSVKLESGGKGVAVASDKAIEMTGKDTVKVDGKKDVTISSSKNIDTSAGQKYAISAGTSLESSCSGSSIKMDGNIDMKAALIKEN